MRRDPHGVVAGNVYDKYGTSNPVARALMGGFLRAATELFSTSVARIVVEVGSGEGHLLAHLRPLKPGARFVGLELSRDLAREAGQTHRDARTSFVAGSAYALPVAAGTVDALLCCETLEHLERPEDALLEVRRVLRPRGRALLSVPREPLWRALNLARGRYVTDLGNTPGHVGHYSAGSFSRLVHRAGLRVIARRTPLPWTLLLAER